MHMKVGVLSDTHLYGVNRTFENILEQHLSDVDMILHAGDYVGEEIMLFLNHGAFHGVQGNMDSPAIKSYLPDRRIINIGSFRIGLVHGWGSSQGLEARLLKEFEPVDVLVYGHSHKPANHIKEGVLLFNPGTATGLASRGNHSIGILHIGSEIRGEIVPVD
jgi:putative phosphoesterase